jgi:5-hydroxyisourate hydrolase-like protein (transthyretin family)
MAAAAFAQDAAIDGTVRDSVTRATVPGVALELTGPDTARTAVTNAKGEYRFENLASGVYKMKFTMPGYLGADVRGPSTVTLTKPGQTAHIPLEITPFARLEGVVLDEEGRPLPGVMVYTGSNYQDTTTADGHYAIEPLQPGSYAIVVRTPFEIRRNTAKRDPETGETFGYSNTEFYPGVADQQAATKVTVSGGLDLRGFDIRLRRVRLVEFSGHALEGAGGMPLLGARIELVARNSAAPLADETYKSSPTDDDGAFRFELIQPGSYSLLIYRGPERNALPFILPIEVPKSGLQDQKIAVPPFNSLQGSIVVPADTDWSGQVILLVHAPTPGLAGRQFTVNSEKFSLDAVPPGKWTFDIESNVLRRPQATKFFIQSARLGTQNAIGEPIVIAESGNPPLEIRLSPDSGRIAGTVVDENGLPRKNAMVLVTRATFGASINTGATRDDGSLLIEGLAPGSYRVMVLDRGRGPSRQPDTVEVKVGETTIVRLIAPIP